MDIDDDNSKEKKTKQSETEKKSEKQVEYVFNHGGLFPTPMKVGTASKKVIDLFRFLGSFVGKSMLDSRLLDLPLSVPFLKWMLGFDLAYEDLRSISPVLSNSLDELWSFCQEKWAIEKNPLLTPSVKTEKISALRLRGDSKVEDLCLDFTLPGYPSWDLKPGGSNITVNIDNLDEYLELVVKNYVIDGVSAQFNAFFDGFNQVFPIQNLRLFAQQELTTLICGNQSNELVDHEWSIETLRESTKCDHGYTHDSAAVRHLFQVMSEFTPQQRRKFMQFVTGTPQLPILGFRGLVPRLTIVKKHHYPPYSADDYLPSVMSCTNYLKLPDYSSKDVMHTKMLYAIQEGQSSFHLS